MNKNCATYDNIGESVITPIGIGKLIDVDAGGALLCEVWDNDLKDYVCGKFSYGTVLTCRKEQEHEAK